MALRPIVIGNWKMNGLGASLAEVADLVSRLAANPVPGADVMICPPATLLSRAAKALAGSIVGLGAQDCHPEPRGAHTGDISAEMLADAGATAVIVGHSERRIDHRETSAEIAAKARAAQRARLRPILCIGETAEQRRDGATLGIVTSQLAGSLPDDIDASALLVAYEPVWAIGTGLTPTEADVAEVHAQIRRLLIERLGRDGASVPILYGGSVKPDNAAGLLAVPEVNGALVGGASLQGTTLYDILATYAQNH